MTSKPSSLTLFTFIGVYRWEESHMEAEYTNWAPNQPNESSDQNCVWKTYFHDLPGWHDAHCPWTSFRGYGEIHALCQTAK